MTDKLDVHPDMSELILAKEAAAKSAATSGGAPPIRPERHIPNSIATLRRRMIIALANRLSRCPCCARQIARNEALLMTQ